MFIIFAAAFQLSTTLTQDFKMPIIAGNRVNQWFIEDPISNQAFVDWEGNQVRQFHTINDDSYPINVTIRVSTTSEFLPFIQESLSSRFPEVDEMTYTLLPKQHYKVAVEYNCTSQEQLAKMNIIIMEQSFKNNPNEFDELRQTSLRYYKYCSNPYTPLIDFTNLAIIMSTYVVTTICGLLCVRKSYKQFDFTPGKQIISLIILPTLGTLIYYPTAFSYFIVLIILYDFTYSRFQSHIMSGIIAILIVNIQYKLELEYLSVILAVILLIQVNKRIVIANRTQLFLFFSLIWLTEMYWLVHITQADKHLLTQNQKNIQSLFTTSISITNIIGVENELQQKHIEIHLYQLLALTLIQSFIFRHGLFNKDHIVNIIIVGIAQIIGLILFDILYRFKYNPPFLTLITGFMLIGISINYIKTGKGLLNPYIEFEELDEKIKI